jgi:RND family efflux transporter MFP subunit
MLKKIIKLVVDHKITSLVLVVLAAVGGYYGVTNLRGNGVAETRYVLAAVEKGTLITSVSGSGQISAQDQIDVKAKVSGDILAINVKKGQEVKAGDALVKIDAKEAYRAVRDAEMNLATAKLSFKKIIAPPDALALLQAENSLKQAERNLAKLQEPPDSLTLLQAENALTSAREAKQKAEEDLAKFYEDGFNTVASAFLDLPNVMAGLHDVLFSNTLSSNQWNLDYYADAVNIYDGNALSYRTDAYNKYRAARDAYDKNFEDYKEANRSSGDGAIEALIDETYDTTKDIAEAVKSTNNLIQFYQDKLTERGITPSQVSNSHIASLGNYTGTTSSQLMNLLSIKTTIKNGNDAILTAERNIEEKTQSLDKIKNPADEDEIEAAKETVKERKQSLEDLKAGADELEILSQQLTVEQRVNALADAQENLADYTIRAPFDGVIAAVNVKKWNDISSGTAVATLITSQRIAEISLNEVDVAQVKEGQKSTLTFDAVSDLTITGEVAEVDTLGTVTQGVVTYNVKIIFDTQDERVKPGMSVSASIVTGVKQDVLLIPNSAIKIFGEINYVEMSGETVSSDSLGVAGGIALSSLRQQEIQTGLANDSSTEVTSGLKEGDQIIIRTISSSSSPSSSASSNSSSRGLFEMGGGTPPVMGR